MLEFALRETSGLELCGFESRVEIACVSLLDVSGSCCTYGHWWRELAGHIRTLFSTRPARLEQERGMRLIHTCRVCV